MGRLLPPAMMAERERDIGDADDAVAFLRARMARHPDRIGVRLNLASVLEEHGELAEAESLLRDAVLRAPDNARARACLHAFLQRPAMPGPADHRPPSAVVDEAAPEAEQAADPIVPVHPTEPSGPAASLVPPVAASSGPAIEMPRQPATQPEPELRPAMTGFDSAPAPAGAAFDLPLMVEAAELQAVTASSIAILPLSFDPAVHVSHHLGTPMGSDPQGVSPAPARQGWRPSIELAAALSIVAVLGLLGVLSTLLPRGLIMAPPPAAGLMRASPGPVSGMSLSDTTTNLPAAALPSPPPSSRTLPLDGVTPTLVIAAQAVPPQLSVSDPPTETPLDVAVVYARSNGRAAQAAEDLAARLRAGGTQAHSVGLRGFHPTSPTIGYYFDEDRDAVVSLSNRLGTFFGPAQLLASSRTDQQVPGAVVLTVP